MAHRDFVAAKREKDAASSGEELTFTVGGETFTVPQPVSIMPLLDLTSVAEEDEQGSNDPALMLRAMVAFRDAIMGLIDEADHARFRRACIRCRADSDLLGEIVRWVLFEATERPTLQPSPSSASSESDGLSSTATSSDAPDLTSAASAPAAP